jgi:hypothetical protein
MNSLNIYNNNEVPSQELYDSFNNFIFSNDIKVFGKLMYKLHFFKLTQHIPGDIVEIGVFKGSGILAWLKILKVFCPNTNKKVIGFDFFSKNNVLEFTKDKESGGKLNEVINRVVDNDLLLDSVKSKIHTAGFNESKYILVEGDIQYTTKNFVDLNPGFRISLLYLDADLMEPTYYSLLYFWDRILPGGYIVFDEYEYHAFNESSGVERFLKEKQLEYSIETTNFYQPTAFMIKKNFK